MSHSRIFQFSEKPIDVENYIDNEFMTDDYIWHTFEGKFCGDYTDTRTAEERLEDIEWLSESLSKFNIKLCDGDKFILGKSSHQYIKDYWYDEIKKAFDQLDKEHFTKYHERWLLKYSVTDPLSHGFGFLFYNNDSEELVASDDFFEWLLCLEEGKTIYIGATLDYHC